MKLSIPARDDDMSLAPGTAECQRPMRLKKNNSYGFKQPLLPLKKNVHLYVYGT
jgi:hypothetical protein